MSDFDDGAAPDGPDLGEIAADPDGLRWARDCAWVPGTGHCRNRPCHPTCLFRRQREAEAHRIERARRQRRRAHRNFADRMVRLFCLLSGVG